jgi:hypothetical protein
MALALTRAAQRPAAGADKPGFCCARMAPPPVRRVGGARRRLCPLASFACLYAPRAFAPPDPSTCLHDSHRPLGSPSPHESPNPTPPPPKGAGGKATPPLVLPPSAAPPLVPTTACAPPFRQRPSLRCGPTPSPIRRDVCAPPSERSTATFYFAARCRRIQRGRGAPGPGFRPARPAHARARLSTPAPHPGRINRPSHSRAARLSP